MWRLCLTLSFEVLLLLPIISVVIKKFGLVSNGKAKLFNWMFAGVAIAAYILFLPVHSAVTPVTFCGVWKDIFVSALNTIQVFAGGCDFEIVNQSLEFCPENLRVLYGAWFATVFVIAPIFTFGFVLSFFKNASAYLKYMQGYFKDVYVFSELNKKSLLLAKDLMSDQTKNAMVVFTNAYESEEDNNYELLDDARDLDAACFKKDILSIDFRKHSKKKEISFFFISEDKTGNLDQALGLIEDYKQREHTSIFIYSTETESELLLTAVDKGFIKVRRINPVRSLIYRTLYEDGSMLFQNARKTGEYCKKISAVVVGLGRHGKEMVKALSWYCQMDGYEIEINAFEKDPLAEEKFIAKAPELMSPKFNGTKTDGEAQYKISIHSGFDVDSISFVKEIEKIKDATYVLVCLGEDVININTANNLKMIFERMGACPIIQAIVYNSQEKNALTGIKNYWDQDYGIDYIGDLESNFTEKVIIDRDLEQAALEIHKKSGRDEEEFWKYEYYYRSSSATAIHLRARNACGILDGEGGLSEEQNELLEALEHRRWNAYMRAEGYVYSGSQEKNTRNEIAKMHNNLVNFYELNEDAKSIDRKIVKK